MEAFSRLFGSLLASVYNCFDPILIQGYLPLLTLPALAVYLHLGHLPDSLGTRL